MNTDPRTLAALLVKLALLGAIFLIGGRIAGWVVGDHPLARL